MAGDQTSRKIPRKGIAIVAAVALTVLALSCHGLARAKDHAGRIDCSGNLQQLPFILQRYADDHGGESPPSLYELVREGYAPVGRFECQSCQPWFGRRPTTAEGWVCDYIYFPPQGVGQGSPEADRTVIVCDKPGNHRQYGNVLYASGRVEGLLGAEWPRQAGIGNQIKTDQ